MGVAVMEVVGASHVGCDEGSWVILGDNGGSGVDDHSGELKVVRLR